MTTPGGERGAIAFAEKVLQLLDEGRYTATYKYAVLLGLLDLVLERTEHSGVHPTSSRPVSSPRRSWRSTGLRPARSRKERRPQCSRRT